MRLFDVLGPVMIGPSSSHTAGAARSGEADEEAICDALYVAAGFGQVIAARATLAAT